jgi:hypothetical protein
MPFKLVCIVEEGLSLGSILMTNGVYAISIDTITKLAAKNQQPEQSVSEHMRQIAQLPRKKRETKREVFKHPSGRHGKDFILEYMKNNNGKGERVYMQKYLVQVGFAGSSINNILSRLEKDKLITNVEVGKYAIRQRAGEIPEEK